MMKLFRLICIFSFCLLLAACGPAVSREYLLTHPDALKSEIERCHEPGIKTNDEAARCETVMSAAETFIKLLKEQQHDPENFGAQVMQAQLACAGKKAMLDSARQHLSQLLEQQASAAEIQRATELISKSNAAYIESQSQVNVMLAVIGVNSPE